MSLRKELTVAGALTGLGFLVGGNEPQNAAAITSPDRNVQASVLSSGCKADDRIQLDGMYYTILGDTNDGKTFAATSPNPHSGESPKGVALVRTSDLRIACTDFQTNINPARANGKDLIPNQPGAVWPGRVLQTREVNAAGKVSFSTIRITGTSENGKTVFGEQVVNGKVTQVIILADALLMHSLASTDNPYSLPGQVR